MTTRTRTIAVLAAALLGLVSACGGGQSAAPADNAIKVWTLENLPDRLEAQKVLAQRFTQATGITVDLVGVDEDQFQQLIRSSSASDALPDVVGAVPLAAVRSLAADQLLDTDATGKIVTDLQPGTFSPRALELTRDGDAQLAVPSDGWAQLLLYRKDLLTAAGLPIPRNYADFAAAAKALNKDGVAGFVGATAAGDAFTQQTFEHVALANNCELVDAAGTVTLDSPQCQASFAFYDDLVRTASVPGAQDADTTRATYFAGKAATMIWSSFILDELAGLRADAAPSCPECAADPRFLVDNTGVVTALSGPDSTEPAQFGEIVSWTVVAGAAADPATRFVEFMMNDGYPDWLGFAPEGKIPARTGTPQEPEKFSTLWRTLPAGVDTKKPLAEFYPPDVLDGLAGSLDTFRRWGFTQGQGQLVGATLGELPVPQAVAAMTSGEVDAAQAAKQADDAVTELQKSLR
ncbi:ABC transporter substrate-binding protein [Pseudonocardia charpentierae]|uniref:Extracellular solute-binding protein n=1 Tax=Pseudonocardia charpentierae TaxID=3075545 RepID=A0ABU2NBU7_9PSEU|nr:extracellular solute-binding protein [Pseudonocardia sp. DSM 45834]MDT0351425.1 extracellular solute-binding protein [Pseudonocardia sp. DSM 45834]